jgi:hypothetical protein
MFPCFFDITIATIKDLIDMGLYYKFDFIEIFAFS